MDNSINIVTAAQRALQRQMVIIANNVANTNTVGYRAESVEFNSLLSRPENETVHYPTVSTLHPSDQKGPLSQTGNPLDMAISGDGWFAIGTATGTAYTRDGRMNINAFGELKTIEGHSILDSGGAPIIIPANSGAPKIHKDGRVEVNGNVIGNIGIYELNEKDLHSRFANAAFYSKTPGTPIAAGNNTQIQQGFLEGSNVNAMQEMVNLIMVNKSFESAVTMVDKADGAILKSIRDLAET